MGYRICYDWGEAPETRTGKGRSRLPAMIAGFFLIFLLLTGLFWPRGTAKLRKLILPGDEAVTGQALTVLVEDLRAGEPVGDAVRAFCGEILTHAQYPD